MGFKIYINKEDVGRGTSHVMISNDNRTRGSLAGCVIISPNSTGYFDGWRRDFFKKVDEVEIDIPRSNLMEGSKLYVKNEKTYDNNDIVSCIIDFKNEEIITDENIINKIIKNRSTVTLKLKSNK